MEGIINSTKQKKLTLINDVNKIEKKLTNEMDYSKNLESQFANTQKELRLAQEQNDEMQKNLEKLKATNELENIELQQQLKALERAKKEVIKREDARMKVTYEQLYYTLR